MKLKIAIITFFALIGLVFPNQDGDSPRIHVVLAISRFDNIWMHSLAIKDQLNVYDSLSILVANCSYSLFVVQQLSKFVSNVKADVEVINYKSPQVNSSWLEFAARNALVGQLKGDFVWHIQENNLIRHDAMNLIRMNCRDLRSVYLFGSNHSRMRSQVFMQDLIVPVNLMKSKKILFGLSSNGDVLYSHLSEQYQTVIELSLYESVGQPAPVNPLAFRVTIGTAEFTVEENHVGPLNEIQATAIALRSCLKDESALAVVGLRQCRELLRREVMQVAKTQGFAQSESVISAETGKLLERLALENFSRSSLKGFSSACRFVGRYYDVDQLPGECGAGVHVAPLKSNDTAYPTGSEDWQKFTNVYSINLINCPASFHSFLRNWTTLSNLSALNVFRIDKVDVHDAYPTLIYKSHIEAYKHLILSDKSYGIILEDGARFVDAARARRAVADVLSWLGGVLDVFVLTAVDSNLSETGIQRLPPKTTDRTSTAAYIISREFARTLLQDSLVADLTGAMGLNAAPYFSSLWDSTRHSKFWFGQRSPVMRHSVLGVEACGGRGLESSQSPVPTDPFRKDFNSHANKTLSAVLQGSIGSQLFVAMSVVGLAVKTGMKYQLTQACRSDRYPLLTGLVHDSTSECAVALPSGLAAEECGAGCAYVESSGGLAPGEVAAPVEIRRLRQASNDFDHIRSRMYPVLLQALDAENQMYLTGIVQYVEQLAAGRPKIFVHCDSWEGSSFSEAARPDLSRYYEVAMVIAIRELHTELPFFVFFGANTSAVRDRFGVLDNSCYLNLADMLPSFSLMLMAQMDGGITSTSLLSWWAAYLIEARKLHQGDPKQPLVIAPADVGDEDGLVYPPRWLQI